MAFKHKGVIVWRFDYIWTDDYHWNLGYKEMRGSFIGTRSEWREFVRDEEWGQGFSFGHLEKRHANAKEFAQYLSDIAYYR